ncbi:MAG: hypothetical protein NZ555_08825 [Geminicoccaceae bacterium]|nr:hypothetical protein [Geminicoccaceae bacterium]MCX8102258.1 hypothetical protein [Geminicoccaceae bacterium]
MIEEPSRAIRLYGTEEPLPEQRELRAGPLACTLEAGNLRWIRIGGIEAIRSLAYIVRDENWGTYNPVIRDLVVDEREDGFTVSYEATAADARQAYRYRARIEGRSDGSLLFEGEGEALADFLTNRTGFVVLHPVDATGKKLRVEHVDGRIVESVFPELIDPLCPFQDIRALAHEVAPGLRLRCTMEGETFEMEDHRNWMDASYKTYVRPLAKPWPYTIGKGERVSQRVTLALEGTPGSATAGSAPAAVTLEVGGPTGARMPALGLAAPAEHLAEALGRADLLAAARPAFLVVHHDPRRGHGIAELALAKELGARLGCPLVLEAVVPCLDREGRPTSDPAIVRRDLEAIRAAVDGARVAFARVAVSPACDLKCTLPGSVWPEAPDWHALMSTARELFPSVPVGGGMFSYFTELNRKRPPADALEFVCHTGCPLVHAGDDATMMENLEALPWQYRTTRSFAGSLPYWIFPTAIAMRDNPYGKVPAENPHNIRQAMNRVDPRERGLIGAAWYAGYLAHAAKGGLAAVTLAAIAGPSGIVSTPQPHARPWYDRSGAPLFPSYHVLRAHARLAGAEVLETRSEAPGAVQITAVRKAGRTFLSIANLTAREQVVRLAGEGLDRWRFRRLDETTFVAAAFDRDFLVRGPAESCGRELALGAYAVVVGEVGDR